MTDNINIPRELQNFLLFWFGPAPHDVTATAAEQNKLWFGKNEDTDKLIRREYSELFNSVKNNQFAQYTSIPAGVLAKVICLDQLPRVLFRNSKEAFTYDDRALELTKFSLENNLDQELGLLERVFLYLPLEHSESAQDQADSVRLFEQLHNQAAPDEKTTLLSFLEYAMAHKKVIDSFGRFPHRNATLERENTAEEIEYLKKPGSGF